MKVRSHKIFFWIAAVLLVVVFGLLMAHIYWGDRFSPATRYFVSPQSHFFTPRSQEFSVAIASDTGANNYVLERIIDNVVHSDKKYAFMLYLGDFVTKKTNTGLSWVLHEIRPRLHSLPFYSTPGNHDVVLDHAVDKSPYRSVLGSTYYWFGYGDVLFIALDSSGKFIEDEQFEWLDDTLRRVRPMFKYCVIYSHRPPVDLRPELMKYPHRMDDASVARFKDIIGHYKIDIMIFGHVHYFAAGTFAGIPIYTTPSGGQEIRSEIKQYGYVSVTFNKGGVKAVDVQYIDFKGPKREYLEFDMARRIFGYVLRDTVSCLMLLAFIFFVGGCVAYIRKRSN